ncbi:MAG TPA: T9SS type A sorting domain-containing protein [Chitinophagaceae bacterium]
MKFIYLIVTVFFLSSFNLYAQLCPGGGLTFATAVGFNQGWLNNCPSSGISHNNQVACEPTTAMDACAPAPVSITGTAGSDIWYYFYTNATTATIVINPSASFDAAIQAFSGSACPGLTDIGCVDVGGNNAVETLNLTGLTIGHKYYFRIFGATASAPNRTGTYTFCGTSASLRQFALPVTLTAFTASVQKSSVLLKWTTTTEIDHDHFDIERSTDNNSFVSIETVAAQGNANVLTNYSIRDISAQPGMNYYRLKIVDINGRFTYSATVASKVNYIKSVVVIKNPVDDILTIQVRQAGLLKLYNNAGQLVRNLSLKKGINEVPVKELKNGIYYLAGNESTEQPEKFVIHH